MKKILYFKQLGLQKGHSKEHAFAQSPDQICESYGINDYTLAVFKAFETVEHNILVEHLRYRELKK